MTPTRSLLFVPGIDGEAIRSALDAAADAVVIDNEDGVAPGHKDEARETTAAALSERKSGTGTEQAVGVRINGVDTARGVEDVEVFVDLDAEPDFLVLPDVNGSGDIRLVADVLEEMGSNAGLLPLIEKPSAMFDVHDIARATERIYGLNFAAIDFQKNVGIPILEGVDLTVPRLLVSMAASSASALAFDKPNLAAVNDPERTRSEAEAAKELGYDGKLAMSVEQAEIINDVFTPSEAEVKRASRIVEAFRDADAGLVTIDGVAVDRPVVEQLESVLERASIGSSE
jgi:citrate lyase beta subunit